MTCDQLKLSNQICFPVYAASRLITREYQPYLDKLEITYPQYLVLLVLWEQDKQPVNEIAKKLILHTNTITPLLKRMQLQGFITRRRSADDERKIIVQLTQKGLEMKIQAAKIPDQLAAGLLASPMSVEQLLELKSTLYKLIDYLKESNPGEDSLAY